MMVAGIGPRFAFSISGVLHYRVTDEDIAAVKASGLSDDQIFEMVVCAAIGQAGRQYDQALRALKAATERSEHAPRDSR
jgi:hypothetical protein